MKLQSAGKRTISPPFLDLFSQTILILKQRRKSNCLREATEKTGGRISPRDFQMLFPDFLLYKIITFPSATLHLLVQTAWWVRSDQQISRHTIHTASRIQIPGHYFHESNAHYFQQIAHKNTAFLRSCLFNCLMDILVTLGQEKSHQNLWSITWCYFIF